MLVLRADLLVKPGIPLHAWWHQHLQRDTYSWTHRVSILNNFFGLWNASAYYFLYFFGFCIFFGFIYCFFFCLFGLVCLFTDDTKRWRKAATLGRTQGQLRDVYLYPGYLGNSFCSTLSSPLGPSQIRPEKYKAERVTV